MGTFTKRKSLLLLSIMAITGLHAQVVGFREPLVEMSVKVGGGFQQLSGAPVKSGPVALVGIVVRKDIERFGARLEVMGNYATYTTKYPASYYSLYAPGQDTLSKGKFQAIYLQVPLMLEYKVTNHFKIMAGPQFSYLASLTDQNGAYSKIYGEGNFLKTTEFSFIAGVEIKVAKKLELGGRIVKGITDVNNSTYYLTPKTWAATGIQVSLSYKIL